jgi:hypothetical protein
MLRIVSDDSTLWDRNIRYILKPCKILKTSDTLAAKVQEQTDIGYPAVINSVRQVYEVLKLYG